MPRVEAFEVAKGFYRPLITIRAVVEGKTAQGLALLDTGADRTIFPAEIVANAGVDFASLPSGGKGVGAGGEFDVGICKGRLFFREWPFGNEFQVAEPGKLDEPLLGREDFFRKFVVRISWHRNPPTMDIDPVVKK